jgi:hypothetical protein
MKTTLARSGLAAALVFLLAGFLAVTPAQAAGEVLVLFYDRDGGVLTPTEMRATSNNGEAGYDNDYLVDPTTLQAIQRGPLVEDPGQGFTFGVQDSPVALALNWPTSPLGYGLVIVDNNGAGYSGGETINFSYQAAYDIRRRLASALAARPDYVPSAKFNDSYTQAQAILDAIPIRATEPVKGRAGQLALDLFAVAYDTMLAEHGPQRAIAQASAGLPWLGANIESTSNYPEVLDLAASLTQPYGWVRLVFPASARPADWAPLVAYAKSKGLKILGQPVRAEDEPLLTREQYRQRFRDFVAAFPQIDAWEAGDQANGAWHSTGMAEKLADAVAEIEALAPERLVVLNLLHQINTEAPEFSMFTWIAANLSPALRAKFDLVLVSLYPGQSPAGMFYDQLMETTRAAFPGKKIGLGEVGYGEPGEQLWWCYDESDPAGEGRRAVVAQYYPAMFDFTGSTGGGFWWNFAGEFPADPALQATLSGLRDRLAAGIGQPSPARNGSWYALATIRNRATWKDLYQQVPVRPYTNYTAGAWAKGTGAVALQIWGDPAWTKLLATVRCDGGSSWKKFTTTAFNSGNRTRVWITFDNAFDRSAGTLLLDDAWFRRQGTTTNLLRNPGFELGNTIWTTTDPTVFRITNH